jgi:hypothetical protein
VGGATEGITLGVGSYGTYDSNAAGIGIFANGAADTSLGATLSSATANTGISQGKFFLVGTANMADVTGQGNLTIGTKSIVNVAVNDAGIKTIAAGTAGDGAQVKVQFSAGAIFKIAGTAKDCGITLTGGAIKEAASSGTLPDNTSANFDNDTKALTSTFKVKGTGTASQWVADTDS